MMSEHSKATIRAARAEDSEDLLHLCAELGHPIDPKALDDNLQVIASRPNEHLMAVACRTDGRVVGWVHARVNRYVHVNPTVEISGLVTDQEERGKGIGRLLMRFAESWASDNGYTTVQLVSNTRRDAAHHFYDRIGYSRTKTEIVFSKLITDKD